MRGSSAATHTIIMGNFNARVGQQTAEEQAIGQFGHGERNEQGQMLVDFCEARKIVISNMLFKKGNRWKGTWRSANGEMLNEIDFILSSCQEILTDASVLNKFTTGSDHHLVRARINMRGSHTQWHQLVRWQAPKKPVNQILNQIYTSLLSKTS
uniref:Endonuclease/exonuclease/phosphatase domain-containing protein n=1 Tax=Plectus sambesii TaxID=2011161 RepID=A0A914W6H3_9BILA